ncbi:hypothetical protein ACFQ88_24385 [Paenibacillus sp. NPDC056579]|uniref:hypothetical protein n=1 Tax=Paenibacillus sp. NPDC056579 TaxID=3345871 RepID=UPI00368697BF
MIKLKNVYHDGLITGIGFGDQSTIIFRINLNVNYYIYEHMDVVDLKFEHISNYSDFLEHLNGGETILVRQPIDNNSISLDRYLRIDGIMLARNKIQENYIITIDIDHLGVFGLLCRALRIKGMFRLMSNIGCSFKMKLGGF